MKISADNHAEQVSRQVYHFQHRLLPRWTHDPDGRFCSDLVQSPETCVQSAAGAVIGQEFAEAMAVERLTAPEGILLTFPPPDDAPACFYAFIVPLEHGRRFLTLEKTEDDFNQGYLSFLCEWTGDGTHLNYGGKTYTNKTAFLSDVSKLLSPQ